jgi:uncharacterized protein
MLPNSPVPASLVTAVAVQVVCQAFKVVLYSLKEKRLALSYFISAGGMPSAHSAFVTALSVSVGIRSGFSSDLFAIAAAFSLIIIYDSWRLRGAVEHHARLLSQLVAGRRDITPGRINLRLGHSPAEIAAGIAFGGACAALFSLIVR